MAILPAMVQWFKLGYFIWIGNGDELYYLAVGSQAYFNHPAYLADPVFVSGGASVFRQLPLLPGVWVAWILALGPLGIDGCWRVIAAVGLALSWYMLLREFITRPWMAALLVVILLVDCGQLSTALIYRQTEAFARLIAGSAKLVRGDFLHWPWRLASPALTQPYLLLNIWLVSRARRAPTASSLALSGVSFGLLFHVYPYYWTTAAAALCLAFLFDRGHRRVYLVSSLIGGLIGSPRILNDIMLRRSTPPDWLLRSDKFIHVSRIHDLRPPILAGLILIIASIWIWKRNREAIYLWAMAVSGYVLYKHHIITGIEVENYHWIYLWGPCCSALLLLMAVSLLTPETPNARAAVTGLLFFITLADAAMGLVLRVAESSLAHSGLELVQACAQYQAQRIDSGVRRFVPNSTAAGENQFTDFAAILENQRPLENYWVFLSPQITNQEWDERAALNGFLLAEDDGSYEANSRERFRVLPDKGWGPWTRNAAVAAERVRSRLEAFRRVVADPEDFLNRYRVRYLGLRTGHAVPAYLTKQGWTQVQEGPFWQVWERPAPSAR
jgi:hypothetical protein